MTRQRVWLALMVVVLLVSACQEVATLPEAMSARATRQAHDYPWGFYPISEESKATLCQALALPPEDTLCQQGTLVYHEDVAKKVEAVFPPGHTTYAEVEAKLGQFPHNREESRHPDGTLVSLRYVYQLANYEGACTYFYVDEEDNKTVWQIDHTQVPGLSDGPIPTRCFPTREE
jgi:hypothetical protein